MEWGDTMQGADSNPGASAVSAERGPFFCVEGQLHLQPPGRIDPVIGHVYTEVGVAVPLVQTLPRLFGSSTLHEASAEPVTVCGRLLFFDGRFALDVLCVSAGEEMAAPGVSPPALVTLAMLGLLPVVP
jgi:hypothetical protein